MARIDIPANGVVEDLIIDGVTWIPAERRFKSALQQLWWQNKKLTIVVPYDLLKASNPDVCRELTGDGKVRLNGMCAQNFLLVSKFQIITPVA